jgi:hypothetical protein
MRIAVSSQSILGGMLNRAIFALLGLMIALLGAGAMLVAVDQRDAVSIGAVVAGLTGLLLIVVGVRQVYAAARRRLPAWYAELLVFGGGVFIGGPRPRE